MEARQRVRRAAAGCSSPAKVSIATQANVYSAISVILTRLSAGRRRLDWQMWFAALGSPQRNAWFLNLIQKLLDGCFVVQDLVGDSSLLSDRKIVKIRAKLYHYDFTRLDTEWNRAIPGTIMTNTTSILRPEQYWYREASRMYLGEIGNESHIALEKQLLSHGYTRECHYGTEQHCAERLILCSLAFTIRKYNLYLIPVFLLMGSLLYAGARKGGRRARVLSGKPYSVSKEKKKQ